MEFAKDHNNSQKITVFHQRKTDTVRKAQFRHLTNSLNQQIDLDQCILIKTFFTFRKIF